MNLPEAPHLNLENVQELSEVKDTLVNPDQRFDPTHVGIHLGDYSPEFSLERMIAERFGVNKDSDDCWRTTYTIGSTATSMFSVYEKKLAGNPTVLLARLALKTVEDDRELDTIEAAYTLPVAWCNTGRGRAIQATYTYSLRKSDHSDEATENSAE